MKFLSFSFNLTVLSFQMAIKFLGLFCNCLNLIKYSLLRILFGMGHCGKATETLRVP